MKAGVFTALVALLSVFPLRAEEGAPTTRILARAASRRGPGSSSSVSGTDAFSVPGVFTLQGRLTDAAGVPVPDTVYQVAFRLYESETGGTALWSEERTVTTRDGTFSVVLGLVNPVESIPASGELHLGMKVGADTEMSPRLRITAATYSLKANEASRLEGWNRDSLEERYVNEDQPNSVSGDMIQDATITLPKLNPSDAGVGQVLKWNGTQWAPAPDSVGGGSGTMTAVSGEDGIVCDPDPIVTNGTVRFDRAWGDARYVNRSGDSIDGILHVTGKMSAGTGSDNPGIAAFAVGSQCYAAGAYSTVPGGIANSAFGIGSAVGGGNRNTAAGIKSTIAGGDSNSTAGHASFAAIGGGRRNEITANDDATIGGGADNSAHGTAATIAGGERNVAKADGSTIAGGQYHVAGGMFSAIGGGEANRTPGELATVAGGSGNEAIGLGSAVGGGSGNQAEGDQAVVSGGIQNTAAGSSSAVGGGYDNDARNSYSTVAGGFGNEASGTNAAVGGGKINLASGVSATVPGGQANTCDGDYSLAAGKGVIISPGANYTLAFGDEFQTYTSDAVVFYHRDRKTRVGIGVTEPRHDIEASDGAICNGAHWINGGALGSSDDISPIDRDDLDEVLKELERARVVRYRLKDDVTRELHLGILPDDAPATIATPERDGINTADAIGWLVAIAKAQQAEIEALKAELKRK